MAGGAAMQLMLAGCTWCNGAFPCEASMPPPSTRDRFAGGEGGASTVASLAAMAPQRVTATRAGGLDP
eukprot:CAMPEP_0117572308 /NCGR_PEP_ID=MMETSP0784-20121206/60279_1 /TAXON_ID=39447 /ORGANISM="" /LENGTH=67 /DNA_ID=CAMNT_0005370653 /DNA_START=96 /DNA_END=295 /DNA_ORIENTATION=+